MWEQLIQIDKDLLVYLNGLGNETWDPFWLYITHQINWWPLFLIVLFLLYKKLSIKQLLLLLVTLTLFFTFTDQMTNLVKNTTMRYRPVNDPELTDIIRNIRGSSSWSYFSGHASNSPLDILSGYLFGLFSGWMFFRLYVFINKKYNLTDKKGRRLQSL